MDHEVQDVRRGQPQYRIFRKYLTYNKAPSMLDREVYVLPWSEGLYQL